MTYLKRKHGKICLLPENRNVLLFLSECCYNELEKRLIRFHRSNPFYD